jgi:hypothetical protein
MNYGFMDYEIKKMKLDREEKILKDKIKELKAKNPFYPVSNLSGKLGNVAKKKKALAERRKLAAVRGYYV